MKSAFKEINKRRRHPDYGLLLAVITCTVISILLIYSIHSNNIIGKVGESYYKTQLLTGALGLVIALAVSQLDYRKFVRLWMLYVPVSLLFVALTFTGLGVKVEGATDVAWLNLGFVQIQPSELLKTAFIMTFAFHLHKDEENMNKPLHMLLICIHGMFPIMIIALQKDFGTAMIFGFIIASMMIGAKISWKYLLAAPFVIAGGLVFLWNFVLDNMHKQRILILFNPGTDPENLEYQQDLGIAALRKGGVFGMGLFSDKKYVSVPEMHNDFLFTHAGQVFGFVGAIGVLAILAYLCLKVYSNAKNARDSLGKFMCLGVFGLFLGHCILNIGMVLKVMPVIGVPLPFLSAGGTAMLTMYIDIGIVLSTYTHNNKRYNMFYDEDN